MSETLAPQILDRPAPETESTGGAVEPRRRPRR